jgi:hypothetical protein
MMETIEAVKLEMEHWNRELRSAEVRFLYACQMPTQSASFAGGGERPRTHQLRILE